MENKDVENKGMEGKKVMPERETEMRKEAPLSAIERRAAQMREQEASVKEAYPAFHLEEEMQDPLFVKLMQAGVGMREAYEFVHRDALTGALISEVAEGVRERTRREMRARDERPAENGTSGRAAATLRERTPSEWSREERERIGREALKGKKHKIKQ